MKNNVLDYFQKINRKKVWFFVVGLTVLIVIFVIFLSYNKSIHQKCPDEYGDDDASFAQKMADFDKWTMEFFETHPDASISDLSNERYNFYVKNNCTDAMRRYNEARNNAGNPAY